MEYLFTVNEQEIKVKLDKTHFVFFENYEYDGSPIALFGVSLDDVNRGVMIYNNFFMIKEQIEKFVITKESYSKMHKTLIELEKVCNPEENPFLDWLGFDPFNAVNTNTVDQSKIHQMFVLGCKHGLLQLCRWLYLCYHIDLSSNKDEAFSMACLNGNLEVAQWINFNHPVKWTLINVETLQYAHDLNKYLFTMVCIKGQLRVAKWLYSLEPEACNKIIDDVFWQTAAAKQHNVLLWIVTLGQPLNLGRALTWIGTCFDTESEIKQLKKRLTDLYYGVLH
jgi:hypothetical protein